MNKETHKYAVAVKKNYKHNRRMKSKLEPLHPFVKPSKKRYRNIACAISEQYNRDLEDSLYEEVLKRIKEDKGVRYEIHKGIYTITSPKFEYKVTAYDAHDDGDYYIGEIKDLPGLLVTSGTLEGVLEEAINASRSWLNMYRGELNE